VRLWLAIISGVVIASQSPPGQEPLALVGAIELPGVQGRIDHLALDTAAQRLFVAALGNNTVEVVDVKALKHLKSLTGFREPQGIAFLPDGKLIAVANGQGSGVQMIDATDYRVRGSVSLGNDSDNVRYDAAAKRILVGFGNGALAAVDPLAGQMLGRVALAGHPESFQLEPTGSRAFVNVPDADQIAVVDRTAMKVIATWPVRTAKSNYPMAYDETTHRLFVGCRRPAKVLIYDTTTGKEVGSSDIVGDTDDLWYDSRLKRLYVSGGERFIDVFQQQDPNRLTRIARVSTAAGARTSLFAADLHRLYLAVPHRGNQRAEIRVYEAH
jgi:DNA-binding beta-propeller fold protein YncE